MAQPLDSTGHAANGELSANNAFVITPSDSTTLPYIPRCISVQVAGILACDTYGNDVNVLLPVPAGVIPLRVTKVYATGTTATGIVGYW